MSATVSKLFDTENGSSLRCSCCGRIELMFRDVPFLVEVSDLPEIRSMLRSVADTDACPDEVWKVSAQTARGPVTMHYSQSDLVELSDLVDGTMASLHLDTLVAGIPGVCGSESQ
jgi:hypothetical protein